jgi:hypothetical protein
MFASVVTMAVVKVFAPVNDWTVLK